MSKTEQWLNDIPLASSRPMGVAEIDALRLERRASRLTIFAVLGSLGVCWLALLIIWMRTTSLDQAAANDIGLASDLLLLATVVAVYRSLARLRLAQQIGQDIAAGKVLQFTAEEEQWRRLAPVLKEAIKGRYFASDETHLVEVLPASARLHTLDGSRTNRTILTPLRETAPVPGFAALAAQWLQPVEGHPTDVSTGGRELSADEHDEIDCYASGAWKRPLFWTTSVTVWAALIMSDLVHERLPAFAVLSTYLIVGYPLAVTWRRFLRSVLISYRLRQDVIARRVIIVGMRAEDASRSAAELPRRILEILPKSHLVWTESGRPALWRRMLPGGGSAIGS